MTEEAPDFLNLVVDQQSNVITMEEANRRPPHEKFHPSLGSVMLNIQMGIGALKLETTAVIKERLGELPRQCQKDIRALDKLFDKANKKAVDILNILTKDPR